MTQQTLEVSAEPITPVIDTVPEAAPHAAKSSRIRFILAPVLLLLVAGIVAFTFNVYWQGSHYVSTDNAQVMGQPVSVGSMSAGRIVSISVHVGDRVHQSDLLAQVALPSQIGLAQNGAPKYDFLGASDTQVAVKSPIDGVVIAVSGAVGATVAQGTPIVTLVDPAHMWVTANVDEAQYARLRVGQQADIHLDSLDSSVVGHVQELTPATASIFGLLPQANTTTNFTKVGQVVPVRIELELGDRPALLGSSAEVKIRVRE
jgi:multidrug resistance efflux pump